MKIDENEDGEVVIKELYSGAMLETSEGNQIGICMRDDTFEINIIPEDGNGSNWWRVNMQDGTIKPLI